ncbi:hypothetical protein JOB18_007266 [Solea senegalensis]|uniref:SEA domain-containing protein n=1 Tax=Solea senegalensis TaxID=28829 RepID=A0AAV6PCI9_SOLSE|nr:hypothetical protein JOB18_007266 [Solea senegalensis]
MFTASPVEDETPTAATTKTTTNAATTKTTTNAATTKTTTNTANAATATKLVSFRSLQQSFTDDLLDTSSEAFINRAQMIEIQLEPVCQSAFPTFISLNVIAFRNGSIFNYLQLHFHSTFVPNITQITNAFLSAASNVTGFDIEGSSITVDGISSSGVSINISLITAFCVVLLSWLLSNQQ